MVNLIHNPTLIFGGSFEPAFLLNIVSLGNLTPELNEGYSKAFFSYLCDELVLEEDRGYIVFDDPGKANMAYKGKTFAS